MFLWGIFTVSLQSDEKYMRLALRQAQRGRGKTSPNPMVGAVVVRRGRIVGRGYHRCPGEPHAEVLALRQAEEKARGATLYVNLEPCCIHGRTPPCTEEIIRAKLARVVCAHQDPNPRVSGKGLADLRARGIRIDTGLLAEQARELNEAYIKHITTGRPLVVLKIAQTLDGKIATLKGDSKWVSSLQSRRMVHRLRAQIDAVLVGVGTVLADDPQLTVRHVRGQNPVKIILDSRLRTPLEAKVLAGENSIIATRRVGDPQRVQLYREQHVRVWELPADERGMVDLAELFKRAGQEELTSVLIEGGRQVYTSALRAGLVDRMLVFVAPRLLGEGQESVGDLGIVRMDEALQMQELKIRRVGPDVLLSGRL